MRTGRIWGSRRTRQRIGRLLSAHQAEARFDRFLDSVAFTIATRWLRRSAVLLAANSPASLFSSSPLCLSIWTHQRSHAHQEPRRKFDSSLATQVAFCLCMEGFDEPRRAGERDLSTVTPYVVESVESDKRGGYSSGFDCVPCALLITDGVCAQMGTAKKAKSAKRTHSSQPEGSFAKMATGGGHTRLPLRRCNNTHFSY